jgi:hypothetical protein
MNHRPTLVTICCLVLRRAWLDMILRLSGAAVEWSCPTSTVAAEKEGTPVTQAHKRYVLNNFSLRIKPWLNFIVQWKSPDLSLYSAVVLSTNSNRWTLVWIPQFHGKLSAGLATSGAFWDWPMLVVSFSKTHRSYQNRKEKVACLCFDHQKLIQSHCGNIRHLVGFQWFLWQIWFVCHDPCTDMIILSTPNICASYWGTRIPHSWFLIVMIFAARSISCLSMSTPNGWC